MSCVGTIYRLKFGNKLLTPFILSSYTRDRIAIHIVNNRPTYQKNSNSLN